MKSLLFLLLFCIAGHVEAQQAKGPYNDAEQSESVNRNSFDNNREELEAVASIYPGNPDHEVDPDPVPIDDYIPLLVIAAAGIIIYNTHTRKRNAT